MRGNTKPWSALGLPAVTVLRQGGAETPPDTAPAPLPRGAHGRPCCWDLPVPSHPPKATRDASEKVWGRRHPTAKQRGRRWMMGKGGLSCSELPLRPPLPPCAALSSAPSILQG